MKQGKGKWWSSLKKEELIQIAPLLLNALHLKEKKSWSTNTNGFQTTQVDVVIVWK